MKNYLVVGGSSGIGLRVVAKLTSMGHNVFEISRNAVMHENADNVNKITYDVSDPEGDFPSIEEPLNGLVYCPGSINLKSIRALKPKDFINDFNINALGAAKAVQSYLPNLLKEENSSIVFFSTVAVQTGMPYHSSIAMAKGAVEGLTKSLAAELAPKIRVNAIAPSVTDTPLANKILSSDEKRNNAAKRHPINKIGSPDEIAGAVIFLLSENSNWITGQILHIDGGLSTLKIL